MSRAPTTNRTSAAAAINLTVPSLQANPATWSDEDLMLLVRSGDPAAFAEIYRRYEHEARRFARSLVSMDDVDDVVAESFAKVLRAINAGRGPVNHPIRYLMVTVRTTASSLHTRRMRQYQVAQRLSHDFPAKEFTVPVADPDLVEAFQSLLPRWRQVIWWTEIEGRSHTEVGDELQITPAAVAALAYRARRALREAYEQRTANADAEQ